MPSSSRRLSLVLDLDTGSYSGRLSTASSQMKTFGGTVDKSSASVRQFTDSFNKSGTSMQAPLQKLRDYVLVLGNVRLALLNVRDLAVGWVGDLLKQSAEVERLTTLMRGLSTATTEAGKVEDAKKGFSDVIRLAQSTGMQLSAVTSAYVKFRSAGLDPTQYSLNGLTQAVAAFGGNSEILDHAAVAIQQMAGKGVISMEELRQQLGEAVPTAMAIMAHSAGMTVAQFGKEVSKGTVQAKPLIQAMLRDMELTYAGSGQRIANTLFGQMAMVKTNMMQLSTSFTGLGQTDGLFATAVESLKEFNALLSSSEGRNAMAELGQSVAVVAQDLASAAKVAIEWRDELKTGATFLVATFAAFQAVSVVKWTMTLATSAKTMSASWATAARSTSAALGDLVQAITLKKVAETAESKVARDNIDAANRAVGAARDEATAKMQAVGVARTAVVTADLNVKSKLTEAEAARQNVTAIESEITAVNRRVNLQRTEVEAARSNIMFAQRDIDLLGTNKTRTDALASAKTNLMVQENKFNAVKAEQKVLEGQLVTANEQHALAENNVTRAKTERTIATRAETVADREAMIAVNGVTVAEEGASVATAALTWQMRAMEVATTAGSAALSFLKGGLALLTNPLTLVAAGLGFAAYQAGWFSNKADAAAQSADRLAKSMATLADVKAATARVDEINDVLDTAKNNKDGLGESMSVSQAIKEKGILGYLSGGVLLSPDLKAKLIDEKNKLMADLGKGSGSAWFNQGSDAAQGDTNRTQQWQAWIQAKTQAIMTNENLNARMEAGDKAAFARHAQLLDQQAKLETNRQQILVDGFQQKFNEATAKGDTQAAQYWSGRLQPAKQALDGMKASFDQTAASSDALNAAVGRGGKGLDKWGKMAVNAQAKAAGLQAAMNGQGKAMAEFNAKLAGGMFAGAPQSTIDSLRNAAMATDVYAASRKAAAEDRSFENAVASMAGKLAQLKARLSDNNGELAKFNAEVAAGAHKDWSPQQLKTYRSLASNYDDSKHTQDVQQTMDRLNDDYAKAKSAADDMWNSVGIGTNSAQKKLAGYRAEFQGLLNGLSGDELANAQAAVNNVIAQKAKADLASTMSDWQQQTDTINAGLLTENQQREQNYQNERTRQQQLLQMYVQNANLGATEVQQAWQRFYQWDAAQRAKVSRENESSTTKLARQWSNLGQNIQNVMSSAMQSFVDQLAEGKLSFKDFAADIIKQLLKVILEALIAYAIMSALGLANNAQGEHVSLGSFMTGQLGSAFGGGSNAASSIGFKAGTHHTGGYIGSPKQTATVAASLFANAPKYHDGGWIGGRQLKPGEVPIIGLEGEQVLTKDQQKALGQSGGQTAEVGAAGGTMPNVQVNVINNSGQQLTAEQGQPEINGKDMIVNVVVEAMQQRGKMRDTMLAVTRG